MARQSENTHTHSHTQHKHIPTERSAICQSVGGRQKMYSVANHRIRVSFSSFYGWSCFVLFVAIWFIGLENYCLLVISLDNDIMRSINQLHVKQVMFSCFPSKRNATSIDVIVIRFDIVTWDQQLINFELSLHAIFMQHWLRSYTKMWLTSIIWFTQTSFEFVKCSQILFFQIANSQRR